MPALNAHPMICPVLASTPDGVSMATLKPTSPFIVSIVSLHILLASNIAETRKFNIETPDVVIKVNPDRMDLVETRMIDGRQCLVIPVDDHIEVNGINVRTMKVKGVAGPKAGGSGEAVENAEDDVVPFDED